MTPTLLRSVLRHVPTSVAVVTAPGPVGMTVGSFSSASLTPPLVSFYVARTSTTWPAIAEGGRFCVNVLAGGQAGLGRAFAAPGDRFAGRSWTPGPHGTPVLDGVLAWLECGLDGTFRVGDHDAVVGRVLALSAREDAEPLLFHRGELR